MFNAILGLVMGLVLFLVGLGGTMSCWDFTAEDFGRGDISGGIIGLGITIVCIALTLFGLVLVVAGAGVLLNIPGFA